MVRARDLALASLLMAVLACGRGGPQAGEMPEKPGVAGEQLFLRLGCAACHSGAGSAAAPALEALYGTVVELEGGELVTADEAYITQSILSPGSRIVSGYGPIMPSYQGLLTDEDLEALVEYVRLLSD